MGGRISIFPGKAGGDRIQGELTPQGSKDFEAARQRLATMAGLPKERISDGETAEGLARGWTAVKAFLAKRLRRDMDKMRDK